jgi:hypothetical protein
MNKTSPQDHQNPSSKTGRPNGKVIHPAAARSLLVAVGLFALFHLGSPLPAQTTFLGQWEEYSPDWVFGEAFIVYSDPYLDPPGSHGNVGIRELHRVVYAPGALIPHTETYWEISPILVRGGTSSIHSDNHWSNSQIWSDGLPDLTTDVRIMDSRFGESDAIILPAAIGAPATARSLAIFATQMDGSGNYMPQTVQLTGGTLNLTPLVLNESLSVGVASGLPKARETRLFLDGATLTSTGFAKIGVGRPVGAGGTLKGTMVLGNGAQWFHPAGLIEVGGGDGIGQLTIHDGLLAGSLLPGASPDPRIVVAPGSALRIDSGGTARFSEVSVNSTHGSDYYDPMHGGTMYEATGLSIVGMAEKIGFDFETDQLDLGTTAKSRAALQDYSDSRLGAVTISRDSDLLLESATAEADSIVVGGGVITVRQGSEGHPASQLTVGNSATELGAVRILDLAPVSGDLAGLSVTGANNAITVRGRAILGGYGAATVNITNGGVLDIRGSATLGEGGSSPGEPFGSGTVSVSGAGSVFRVQNLNAGYNEGDYRGAPSPLGRITVGGGGRVEVTGYNNGTGWSALPDAEGNYTQGPTIEAGRMTLGKNGTLDILAGGQLAFTDPTGGTAVRQYGTQSLTSSGLIQGGGTTATDLAGGSHIDFGALGGKLVNTGTIAPGHSAGWLSLNGDLAFQDPMSFSGGNGRLLIELGGTTAGLNYDVLEVLGDADLRGGTVEFSFINGFAPVAGTTFYFMPVTGTLTGMFDALVDHTGLGLTLDDLSIAPGGGLQLIMPVSAIPEAGTIMPALAAALVAVWRLRRKWRR